MFGAIFILGVIVYAIISIVRDVSEDYECRQMFRDNVTNTYISYDGIRRDLDNGKPRWIYRKNGDRYMEGDDIGTINLSQIERNKQYEMLKNNHSDNVTVAFYQNAPRELHVKRGVRYKDLETGEIYVVREDRYGNRFFVTLSNRVVRYTDMSKKWAKEYKVYSEEKEIEYAKEFQMEIDKASQNPFWEDPTIIFQKTRIESMRG